MANKYYYWLGSPSTPYTPYIPTRQDRLQNGDFLGMFDFNEPGNWVEFTVSETGECIPGVRPSPTLNLVPTRDRNVDNSGGTQTWFEGGKWCRNYKPAELAPGPGDTIVIGDDHWPCYSPLLFGGYQDLGNGSGVWKNAAWIDAGNTFAGRTGIYGTTFGWYDQDGTFWQETTDGVTIGNSLRGVYFGGIAGFAHPDWNYMWNTIGGGVTGQYCKLDLDLNFAYCKKYPEYCAGRTFRDLYFGYNGSTYNADINGDGVNDVIGPGFGGMLTAMNLTSPTNYYNPYPDIAGITLERYQGLYLKSKGIWDNFRNYSCNPQYSVYHVVKNYKPLVVNGVTTAFVDCYLERTSRNTACQVIGGIFDEIVNHPSERIPGVNEDWYMDINDISGYDGITYTQFDEWEKYVLSLRGGDPALGGDPRIVWWDSREEFQKWCPDSNNEINMFTLIGVTAGKVLGYVPDPVTLDPTSTVCKVELSDDINTGEDGPFFNGWTVIHNISGLIGPTLASPVLGYTYSSEWDGKITLNLDEKKVFTGADLPAARAELAKYPNTLWDENPGYYKMNRVLLRIGSPYKDPSYTSVIYGIELDVTKDPNNDVGNRVELQFNRLSSKVESILAKGVDVRRSGMLPGTTLSIGEIRLSNNSYLFLGSYNGPTTSQDSWHFGYYDGGSLYGGINFDDETSYVVSAENVRVYNAKITPQTIWTSGGQVYRGEASEATTLRNRPS